MPETPGFVFAPCPHNDCQNPEVAVPASAIAGDVVVCDLCLRTLVVVDMDPPTLNPASE